MNTSGNDRNRGMMESTGETLGGVAGKMAGRAADVAMQAAGTMAASTFQALGGWWTGDEAERAVNTFTDNQDAVCRRHFESSSSTTSGAADEYDRVRPAYGFGYVARHNPDYRGRSFDDVEPDLQTSWQRTGQDRTGEWRDVQERVRFGYESL